MTRSGHYTHAGIDPPATHLPKGTRRSICWPGEQPSATRRHSRLASSGTQLPIDVGACTT